VNILRKYEKPKSLVLLLPLVLITLYFARSSLAMTTLNFPGHFIWGKGKIRRVGGGLHGNVPK